MKILIRVIAALAVLLLALGGLAWFLFDGEQVRPQLEAQLSELLDRRVQIASLELDVIGGQLIAQQITIADDPSFSDQPFVQADRLDLRFAWMPLFTKRALQLRSIQLLAPTVAVRQGPEGSWNFSSLGASEAAAVEPQETVEDSESSTALSVDQLRIEGGLLLLTLSDGRERRYEALQLSADQLDAHSAFPFSLSAKSPGEGSLRIEGSFGPWQPGAAMQSPMQAAIRFEQLDLASSGIVGADAAVAGLIDFEGTLASANESLSLEGKVRVERLQLFAGEEPLAVPVVVDYAANYDLRRRSGQLTRGSLGSGGAGLELSGKFEQSPKGLSLDMRAVAEQLAIDEIRALLPGFGIRLPEDAQLAGGTLTADMTMRGRLDRLDVAGPVQLDNTEMVGFSLGDKLGVALSLAGLRVPTQTQIGHAGLRLRSGPDGMRVDDLQAEMVGLGEISGAGTVAADDSLDFALRLQLDQGLADSAGALGSGGARMLGFAATSGIGITVRGNLDSPQFSPDQSTVANAVVSGLLGSRRDRSAEDPRAQPEDVVGSLLQGLSRRKKDD